LLTKTEFIISSGILEIGISGVTFPVFGAIINYLVEEKAIIKIEKQAI
jgi:hypothetical protein